MPPRSRVLRLPVAFADELRLLCRATGADPVEVVRLGFARFLTDDPRGRALAVDEAARRLAGMRPRRLPEVLRDAC